MLVNIKIANLYLIGRTDQWRSS